MIQSAATKYAIRALCHLAQQPPGSPAQAREISETLDIPYHYLSKILQDLARKGVLASTKGPGGGFRLNRPAGEISLYAVIEAVEGPISDDECMLGLETCSDEAPCPMHVFWKGLRSTFRDRMKAVSLTDIVRAAERKQQVRLAHLALD